MKYLITIILLCTFLTSIIAQEGYHEHSYSADGVVLLDVDAEYGDLKFEAWDQEEISIEGNVKINGQANSQAFKISQHQKGGNIYIRIKADFEDHMRVLTIRKKDGSVIYKEGKNISIQDRDQEDAESVNYGIDVDATFLVKVPKDLELYVSSTYGNIEVNDYFTDLEVENTYGAVDATFTSLPSDPQLYLSSTYSHVDVSIPPGTDAQLKLETGYGKIFTDLDFDTDQKAKSGSCDFGQDISAVLNKGNGSIELKAEYSNIYLRGIAAN